MQNDIARVVEELFLESGLRGYTVTHERVDDNRWSIWYVIPMGKTGEWAKYGRLVINFCQVDARSQNGTAPEDARVLGAEVCTEGNGRTLLDLGFFEAKEEAALDAATRLIEWVRERTGVGEKEVNFINLVSDAFKSSGLTGTLYPNDNSHISDVCYCLPKRSDDTESIVLSVIKQMRDGKSVFSADACGEETGTILFSVGEAPVTEESVRKACNELIEWAKT